MPPPIAFSGTITVSPGCSTEFNDRPAHKLSFEPITDPSPRITKIAFLFAIVVGPPACSRYHFALFPDRYDTAVGLKTWPDTITKPGRFGITNVSPARTSRSAVLFLHRLMSPEIRIATRPTGGFAPNCVNVV